MLGDINILFNNTLRSSLLRTSKDWLLTKKQSNSTMYTKVMPADKIPKTIT